MSIGLDQTLASFAPYMSEFEYSPEFHPSKNPSCPRRWSRGARNERHSRSPEEGGPVGQEPSIEIRALLVRCPKLNEEMAQVPSSTSNIYNITPGRSEDILQFHGFDRDEPARHSEVKNCRRKLIVTMKFNNIGKTRTQEEFVVVDHVLDPVTMRKTRLLNPFVFKVRQEQVLQLYGLKFQSVVNGEAKEEVINKKSSNYTGCDDSLANPTCGRMMFQGKPVPYSQGFCCSCDPEVSLARQPTDQRSESLPLETLQKIMPDRNEKQEISRKEEFTSPKISQENSQSYIESLRNPAGLSKRERGLKSSRALAGVSDNPGGLFDHRKPSHGGNSGEFYKRDDGGNSIGKKHVDEINFQKDQPSAEDFLGSNLSPALRVALSNRNPSRGKIEPYIDAVRVSGLIPEAGIIEKSAEGLSKIGENVDSDVSREFKEPPHGGKSSDHVKPSKEKYRNSVPRIQSSELTAELVKLENEYEALKKSRKTVKEKRKEYSAEVFGNHSKCRDFRKLARDRSLYSNPDLPSSEIRVGEKEKEEPASSDYNKKRGAASGEKRAIDSEKNKSIDQSGNEIGRIYSSNEKKNSETETGTASSTRVNTPRQKLYSSKSTLITGPDLSPRSSSAITTIPSNDTEWISTPESTTYPALILRQELANDKVYSPSILGDILTDRSFVAPDTDKNLAKSAASNSRVNEGDKLSAVSSETSNIKDKSFSSSETPASGEEGKISITGDSGRLKSASKDRYADWVIKYGKMRGTRYTDTQLEEPIERCDSELNLGSSTESEPFRWSQDSLSHIADRVLKEVESAENEASLRHAEVEEEAPRRPVAVRTLNNNPDIVGGTENLGRQHFSSAIARDVGDSQRGGKQISLQFRRDEVSGEVPNHAGNGSSESGPRSDLDKENARNSSKTSREILAANIQSPNEIELAENEKLIKKSREENSTADSGPQKIYDPEMKPGYLGDSGKKEIEPAAIVRGTGDLVKGRLRYQDQSATVIADRRSDIPQLATDQDYIFLDENGKEERLRSMKSHDLARLTNLREYLKSDRSNNSGLHSMGRKIEAALLGGNRDTEDAAVKEKFNRLDNLVRDSLRSRRRSFRSIAYDDPFHRGNDEKQAKIDQQIEKEFTEITEALKESSGRGKSAARLSSVRQTDSRKDLMVRDLAAMLNRIPKNEEFKTAAKIGHPENGIEKLKGHRSADDQTGRKRFRSYSKRRRKGSMHHVPRHISTKMNSEETLISKSGRVSSEFKRERPRHSIRGGARNSLRKNIRQESQTNINEIVKEIIKKDYRPSQSGVGRQEYSQRRKNIAGEGAYDVSSEKPSSIFSLKSILHGLHIGKIEKKCKPGGSTTPMLRDDEKYAPGNLPPEDPTVITTSAGHEEPETTAPKVTTSKIDGTDTNSDADSGDVFHNVESTLSAEETTPVSKYTFVTTTVSPMTVSSIPVGETVETNALEGTTVPPTVSQTGHSENTESASETEISTLSQELTTHLPGMTTSSSIGVTTTHNEDAELESNHEKSRRLSSLDIIGGLKRFSNKIREETLRKCEPGIDSSIAQTPHEEGYSNEHTVIERSPVDSGTLEPNESEATTWMQDDVSDPDYEDGGEGQSAAGNSMPEKKLTSTERATGQDQTTNDMLPTTLMDYGDTSDDGDDSGDASSSDKPTNNNEGTTSDGKNLSENQEPFTVYEETTIGEERSTANDEETMAKKESTGSESTVASADDYTTFSEPWTTSTENVGRYDTTGPVFPVEKMTTESPREAMTYEDRRRPTPGSGGNFPNEEEPKGLGELLGFNNTGRANIILVKTYSVSKNPGEFLNNYEFPIGVKKVLLKRLNVTTFVHDPADLDEEGSFVRKISKLVVKGKEDGDDSEIRRENVQPVNSVLAEMKKVNFDDSVGDDFDHEKGKSSKYKKWRINDPENFPRLKNRRTIHEPSINDLKLQELQEDSYKNGKFNQQSKKVRGGDAADYPDLAMNEGEDTSDTATLPNNEFVWNNGLKVTQSFAAPDTLPPDDEATHSSWNDDVNATNVRLNSVMEEPIFTQLGDPHLKHKNLRRKVENKKGIDYVNRDPNPPENENRNVEFLYDYDSDPDANEVKRFYRFNDVKAGRNVGRIIGPDGNLVGNENSMDQDDIVPTDHARLKKREVKDYRKDVGNAGGSAVGNRSFLYIGRTGKGDKIPGITPRDNKEIETGTDPGCSGKWRGKIDFLKLKKHQDILKEYLNWSPNVDTTVMGIFSIASTAPVSPTIEKSWDENKNLRDSSTMSIVLIEDGGDVKPKEQPSRDQKIDQFADKEILDKLSKMPINDSLVIIPVTEKNKSNLMEDDGSRVGIVKRKRSERKKYERGKTREKLDGDSRQRRTINSSRRGARNSGSRKGRNGRRLMSTVQLSENKDNGLVREEDTAPDEGQEQEAVEKYEAMQEYEDLVPKGDAPSFDYLDSSYAKNKRDKLKSNWEQLIDKVIVNSDDKNNDNDRDSPSSKKRSSGEKVDEVPSGKEKSAMEKLHFFDADKYIKLMAEKISRLSNVDNNEQDLAAEKEDRLANDSRKSTNAPLNDEHYLTKYRDGIDTAKVKEDAAAFAEDEKNQVYEAQIPYEKASQLVEDLPTGQSSLFGKLGNDFEISISGKVHINGESENQPISISIEGLRMDNVTSSGYNIRGNPPSSLFQTPFSVGTNKKETDFRIKQSDHIYLDNLEPEEEIPANSYDKKEIFFGEAGADARSPNVTSIHSNRDILIAERPENSFRLFASPKKTLYNVVVRAHPRYEKWPIQSTGDFTGANESSEDFGDDVETEERRDAPENDLEKSTENLSTDEPVFDFAKLELRHQKPPAQVNFEARASPFLNRLDEQLSIRDEVDSDLPVQSRENSHPRKRHARQLQEERATRQRMSDGEEGDDEQPIIHESGKSAGSSRDIELVKLIPVELLNGNEKPVVETEQQSLLERKPADLISSELPELESEPGTVTAGSKRDGMKSVRRTMSDSPPKSTGQYGLGDAAEMSDDFETKREPENLRKMKPGHENERSKPRGTTSELMKSVLRKASRNSNLLASKYTLDTRESEGFEPPKSKVFAIGSPKEVSKIAEPCFGEKQFTSVVDIPDRHARKNFGRSKAGDFSRAKEPGKSQGVANEGRLSTDDLLRSSQPSDRNGDMLIKGVKISSPGDDPRIITSGEEPGSKAAAPGGGEYGVCDSLQNSRKAIQLKNLMTMMNFVKKLEDIFPGPDAEEEILDDGRDPESVVEVQSVLLVPKDSSGILRGGNDESKCLQDPSERVVEIGEGVKHGGGTRRTGDEEKNQDIVILGPPTRIDKNSNSGNSMSRTAAGKDKTKSSMFKDQAISEPRISGTDFRSEVPENYESLDDETKNSTVVPDESELDNAAKLRTLFKTVQEKIKHRLSEMRNKTSRDNGSSANFLPLIYLKRRNDEAAVLNEKDHADSPKRIIRTSSNVDEDAKLRSDDVLNLMLENRRQEKSGRASNEEKTTRNDVRGLDFEEENGLPEIVLGPVKFDQVLGKLSDDRLGGNDVSVQELHKIGNTPNKEGPENLKRKERPVLAAPRRDLQLDREARTPVTYAVGASEMGAEKLKATENKLPSVESGGVIHEEKDRTQHLEAESKMVDGRERKKRRHEKKKKKKKKRKKKKKKKKKKKWWPFKRNLLAVFENEENGISENQNQPATSIPEGRIERKTRTKKKKKRQIKAGGAQVRGGQDCMDRRHPPHVNSAKYQESAHCLRFSDLWYSVYELETPIIEHTVYLQVFEKRTLPDGVTHWEDLTQGRMIRVGTFARHERDSASTISFTYSGPKVAPERQARNLDPGKDRLLVPSPVAREKMSKYPEVKGGSGEYLVVPANAINKDGNECDKAGVGFAAFATQPNRCGRVKGTCLKNQPSAYRRHDMEAREAGKPGCYFLSNFASVPNNPIKYNVSGSGGREYLALEYHSPHVSTIDIEVRADYNAIVRVGSSGRVTEVHVDSTAPDHTIVTIVVSNVGLASSPYQSRITDCPTGLPISWSKAKGAMQVIPPQHDQRITLDLYGQLFVNSFHCSVEVVNHRGELVAMRRIRVQKMDRCFCVWHCLCACIGSLPGLRCQPMSPEHYHAAGFQGPVPVVSSGPSIMANTMKEVTIISAFVVLFLLGLGILKWLIGVFVPVVGRWGLDVLLARSQMVGYFEPELCCRSIVRDCEGKIVHPDTRKKSVRICGRRKEFFLNLTFFLTCPIAVCCSCARNSLANKNGNDCCQDESKVCLLKDEGSPGCSNLICLNTYGDSRNSKMEAEDTRYVMDELKRSRDSLQDGMEKRSKNSRSLSTTSSEHFYLKADISARDFVAELIRTRVVFRNLDRPVGGLNVPKKTEYSLRGYFMKAENSGYRFITPCPFKQHWLISKNNSKKPLKPAKIYPSNQFMRTFNDAKDVYESEEISVKPKGICINVQFFDEERS